jgi:hypothetical protein
VADFIVRLGAGASGEEALMKTGSLVARCKAAISHVMDKLPVFEARFSFISMIVGIVLGCAALAVVYEHRIHPNKALTPMLASWASEAIVNTHRHIPWHMSFADFLGVPAVVIGVTGFLLYLFRRHTFPRKHGEAS